MCYSVAAKETCLSHYCPNMARVYLGFLSALLLVLIVQGKHNAQSLPGPKELNISTKGDPDDLGVSEMNIEWEYFTNSIIPDKVTYDVEIFYTEQKKLVHNETIVLNVNPVGYYKWIWNSPIPLQCTSHSVRLRYRGHDYTSAWTPLKDLPGNDRLNKDEAVYPKNALVLVNKGIRFCCIIMPEHKEELGSDFKIQISNRTYITNPILHTIPSNSSGFDITCRVDLGSTFHFGYAPGDCNITCETRDLISVECRWTVEQQGVSEQFKVDYSINGRDCDSGFCVLNMSIDTGVMNWTLTAENKLGKKISFDTADPKHRVHLKGPTLTNTTQFTARNATLAWKWQESSKIRSLPMICQVEVNGLIINECFNGTGLSSVVLVDLQPFTEYEVRVRCGSFEHFYKWGDWSNPITFVTKEDIPGAVDVWMQLFDNQTYVVWKSLSAAQSHGNITGYMLTIGSSTDSNEQHISKSPAQLCHKLKAGSAETYHVINISAKNSAGSSRSSSIIIPNLPPDGDVSTSDIKGNNGTFTLVWEPSPKYTRGYVLDWYPTYNAQQCAVKWMKVPTSDSSAKISSVDTDFKDGVKYTLSVYGCTSGALYMLQRREGYMVELAPSGTVQNLQAKQKGPFIYLSWSNVQEQEQMGFIKGYNIFYSSSNGDKRNVSIPDPSSHEYRFSLLEGTYTFTVKAFTSAGEGPGYDVTLPVDRSGDLLMYVVPNLAIMFIVVCIIAILAYRNRNWLKSELWPEIPKPKLSEEFLKSVSKCQLMDQKLKEESEMLKVKSPEFCPELIVLELQKEHPETQALSSSQSKDSLCSENCQTSISNVRSFPPIIVDFSYKQLPHPGIQNPTYNLPLLPATDNLLVSDYMPQTQ